MTSNDEAFVRARGEAMNPTPAPTRRPGDVGHLDGATPLPIVRSPMLDRHGQLVAYELLFHRDELGAKA